MVYDGFGRHTPILSGEIVVRALSVDSALLPHFGDALGNLADSWRWVEVGDSVGDVVQACANAVASWYAPMNIGQVSYFLMSLPDGWLAADGSTYDGDAYPELFDALDSQFKDEGQNEFTLPNLGGLFLLANGGGFVLGDTGGADGVSLSIAELPSHDHTYVQPIANVDLEAPGVPDILAAGVGPGTTTGLTGGGEEHDNMPPYIVLIVGVFCGRV